jgi:hypothetical protein
MTQSSSVLFSLQELARMEEERVRTAAATAEQSRQAEEWARREKAERLRTDREARERAETEALREVEQRAREEAARIEAIHRAAVETARVQAQAKAQAEARDVERRHEIELERARATARGSGGRATLVGAAFGAIVAAGVAMAVHYGVVAPRTRARESEERAQRASIEAAMDDARSRASAAEARAQSLDEDLASTRAAMQRLREELDATRRLAPVHVGSQHPQGTVPRGNAPRLDGFATCPPGSKDPMCLH